MASLSVAIEVLEAKRLVQDTTRGTEVKYKARVSLSEKERSPGKAVIAFTLDFGAQPDVAKLVLSGSATIEGTRPEIQQFLATERAGRPPIVLAKIYEQVYGAVYLICNSIEVPCPLPTLMKE